MFQALLRSTAQDTTLGRPTEVQVGAHPSVRSIGLPAATKPQTTHILMVIYHPFIVNLGLIITFPIKISTYCVLDVISKKTMLMATQVPNKLPEGEAPSLGASSCPPSVRHETLWSRARSASHGSAPETIKRTTPSKCDMTAYQPPKTKSFTDVIDSDN